MFGIIIGVLATLAWARWAPESFAKTIEWIKQYV